MPAGWSSARLSRQEEGHQGILAPSPTGVAATDTANIQAAIAEAIDTYGDNGAIVYLRGGRYVINQKLVVAPGGGLVGAGPGGRYGVGFAPATVIDSTAITSGAAIEAKQAGQTIASLYLDGLDSAPSSRLAGAVGIDISTSFTATVRDVFMHGFANQILAESSQQAVLSNVIGYGFTTHGFVAVGASAMALRDCPLSNPGTGGGVIDAHQRANFLLDSCTGAVIDNVLWDETLCNVMIVGASREITITGNEFFSGNVANATGIIVGDGTNAVRGVHIKGLDIRPYQHFALASTRGVVIAANVTDTVLEDLTIHESDDDPGLGWYQAGNGLTDGGTGTVYRNVKIGTAAPINTAARKAGVPADGDYGTPPPIGTQVLDTTDGKIYYRTAAATWKAATLT